MEYYINWAEQKPASNFQTLIIGRREYRIGTSMVAMWNPSSSLHGHHSISRISEGKEN